VLVSPWFDRFFLLVIISNCVFLALDKEVDLVTNNNDLIDLIYVVLYSIECVMKIIAQGFVMKKHSYLRDHWNILDFTVVGLGWLSRFVKSGDISSIKIIRLLRPLMTINQIPNMSSLVSTILNSLPIIFDVMVVFMLIMFGTIATQLLGGHLEKRCFAVNIFGEESIELGKEKAEIICLSDEDCMARKPEDVESSWCAKYGNPV
jgi:hypothetical protein